jgi:hypothetical protein
MAVALVLVGVLLAAAGLMLWSVPLALLWLGLCCIAAGLFVPGEVLRAPADRPASPAAR